MNQLFLFKSELFCVISTEHRSEVKLFIFFKSVIAGGLHPGSLHLDHAGAVAGTVNEIVLHAAVAVELIEILENRLFQNIRMEFGNAVDRVRADHRKVCHAHSAVAENGHFGNAIPVAGEGFPGLFAKTLVDLLDDRVDAREF